MSNFVAVDCSSKHLTVIAKKGENSVVKFIENCATAHSVMLMDAVQSAMDGANLTPAECDYFAAVTGPGSFTGIRIGISTVKGLAAGAKKPVAGLTVFDMLAYNVKAENFAVVVDAAHSHCYVKTYNPNAAPVYLPLEEVEALPCSKFGFEELNLSDYTRLNPADCLLAAADAATPSNNVRATYVRKSQAQEGRK